MEPLKRPFSNRYSNPTQKEMKEFYNSAYRGNIDTLNRMLDNGFPPNALIGLSNEYYSEVNAALYTLDVEYWNDYSFDVIDILLENGININFLDDSNNSLLVYLLATLELRDFSEEVKNLQLKSKFELESVVRMRKTFDKLMKMKPLLSVGEMNSGIENIFDFAMSIQVLHWFAEHLDNMTEEDRILFEEYRLAALFEVM